jgi:hypothetical protein
MVSFYELLPKDELSMRGQLQFILVSDSYIC